MRTAKTGPESNRVQPLGQRSIVRQLPAVLLIRRPAELRSAASKGVLNLDGGNRVIRRVSGCLMVELKARLVNSRFIEDSGFGQSKSLLGAEVRIFSRS